MTDRIVTIFGNGKQVRDVLFVDDLLNAFDFASHRIDALCGRAFNIGGGPGNTLSLLELVEHLEATAGRLDVAFAEWRVGDQRYYVSDTRAFSRATGWNASVAPTQGLAALHEWLEETALPDGVRARAASVANTAEARP